MSNFPAVGEEFGPFSITGEVGRGGMGVVFAAYQKPLNRPVALKVLDRRFSDDPSFVARFTREAELLAKVNSPHVIQVYASGQEGSCLYLAMQPIMGGDLAEYLRKHGPLGPDLAANLTEQVAMALADAHAVGIIHRDIKPSNVLLSSSAGDLFAYLCDFGIAHTEDTNMTQTGVFAGSLAFSAPERHEGYPADVRSDLYSLGCLFWALLSGANPYSGTGFKVAEQHFSAPIPQVPGEGLLQSRVNQLLAMLMAKDPARRPASAVDVIPMLREIQRIAESGGTPSGYGTPPVSVFAPPQDHYRPPSFSTEDTVLAVDDTSLISGDTVLEGDNTVLGKEAPVPLVAQQPQEQHSNQPPQKKKGAALAMVAVAVVLVVALIGTGAWWTFSRAQQAASSPLNSKKTPDAANLPSATTTSSDPAEEPEPTAEPIETPSRTKVSGVVNQIKTGAKPHGLSYDPVGKVLYVANYGDDSVTAILDTEDQWVSEYWDVGSKPQSIVAVPGSGIVLLGADGANEVQIWESESQAKLRSIKTGGEPNRITLDQRQGLAYVVNQKSPIMQVIDTSERKLIDTIDVGSKPRVIGIDEEQQVGYIGYWDTNQVAIFDLRTKQRAGRLKVGFNPNDIVIAPKARLAFVANYGEGKDSGGSVSVIDLDTRSVVKTIETDAGPSRFAIDEAAGVVYLTTLYANKVNVISISSLTITDRLKTNKRPTGVAVDTQTGRLFVSSFDQNVVQVFS